MRIWILLTGLCSVLQIHAQNHSYTIIYDQVYPLVRNNEFQAAKTLFEELHGMYTVDPAERGQFAFMALQQAKDVDYFKATFTDLIRNYGYHFSYDDTLRPATFPYYLREYGLTGWLIEQSNTYYPKWVAENPTAFHVQQRILKLDKASETRTYFQNMLDTYKHQGDSLAVAETIKYLRELDFGLLYEIITICRAHGLPTNFEFGGTSYTLVQKILSNNALDEFNFERTWHHVFPFLETAYFHGKISSSFLKLYDRALNKHYGYQYYGTLENVEVKDPDKLKERRAKYNL